MVIESMLLTFQLLRISQRVRCCLDELGVGWWPHISLLYLCVEFCINRLLELLADCVCLQALSRLVEVSEGDLRKAITFLQSATRLTAGKEITDVVVTEIAGVRSAL